MSIMDEKISLKTAVLRLPPCKVCEGKASGIHYGINTCEACKGFFRRYLSRKEPYKCAKEGKCVITDSPRGNCSACRMEKCLQLGMSKEAVRQGRYTLTERTKAIIEVQKLQQKVEDCPIPQETPKDNSRTPSEHSPDSGIMSQTSPADSDNLENSVISDTPVDSPFTVHIREDRDMMEFSSNSQSELTKECGSSQAGTDYENIKSILDELIPRLTKCAEDLSPVSSKLTDEEIHSLHMTALNKFRMKQEMFGPMEPVSIEEYNHLYEATGLDVDGRQSRLQRCRSFFEGTIKHYVQFSRVIPEFPDLPVPDQSSLLKAARFEFFMLLEYRAVDPDLQMVLTIGGDVYHINEASIYFPKEIMLSWFEFSRVIRRLNLSDKERALVLAISLVFRDRCKLEDPERVERIQLTLISYLRYVLKERYGRQEVHMFSKVMNMFLSFRVLTESYMKQYQELCKDKFLPKQFPEMLEFLFEDDMSIMDEKISFKTAVLQLPPCRVCEGKASGIHYGINTCEPCKGFFRRYLTRKKPYKCDKKGKCIITDKPRGNCSACRMEKCIKLGMSKEAVRQGRYTLTQRTNTIIEVQKIQQKVEDSPVPKESPKDNNPSPQEQSPDSGIMSQASPYDLDSMEPSVLSDTIITIDILEDLDLEEFSSNSQSEVTKDSGCSQTGTDSENIKSVLDELIPRLTKCAEELSPVLSKLTDEEIHSLHMTGLNKFRMKQEMFGRMEPVSTEEYNNLYEATGLDVDGRQIRIQKRRNNFERIIKHYVQFSRAIPEFHDLPVADRSSLLKAARFEFFMLLNYRAIDPDLQMVITIGGDVYHVNEAIVYFPKEVKLSWLEFSRVIRRLDLSDKERSLVLAISLVFRDRCKLEDPERVERIQMTLISYLRYVLKERYGQQEVHMFSKVMNMFSSFRILTENFMKQFNELCKDKFLPKKFPEMLEFLFEDY
ncbi:uncharacterized protein LOC117336672 [Pecten maximus]|uniref:uncharacterized protein LOC117336672 n=1 Tax=Pecten maximus TaxID=6579 RepID=UPI001458A567|nr:uncharacterized protein LOC117336672 [Pecten maximus]